MRYLKEPFKKELTVSFPRVKYKWNKPKQDLFLFKGDITAEFIVNLVHDCYQQKIQNQPLMYQRQTLILSQKLLKVLLYLKELTEAIFSDRNVGFCLQKKSAVFEFIC